MHHQEIHGEEAPSERELPRTFKGGRSLASRRRQIPHTPQGSGPNENTVMFEHKTRHITLKSRNAKHGISTLAAAAKQIFSPTPDPRHLIPLRFDGLRALPRTSTEGRPSLQGSEFPLQRVQICVYRRSFAVDYLGLMNSLRQIPLPVGIENGSHAQRKNLSIRLFPFRTTAVIADKKPKLGILMGGFGGGLSLIKPKTVL